MSEDSSRLGELQSALRTKMDDNKAIADSFQIENGVVQVDAEQKSAFDKNMADIKEIQSLVDGIKSLEEVSAWGAQPDSTASVAAAAAAGAALSMPSQYQTIGEQFTDPEEFKSLANGRNGANMPNPWQYEGSLTTKSAADDIDTAIVTGLHGRAVKRLGGRLGVAVADDLIDTVGNSGAAHPALLLADALDTADAGRVVALVVLADGVEVLVFRSTDALAAGRPSRSVAAQVEDRADVAYPTYLAWRGLLEVQPPNRPAPNRISASAALRRSDWKHGFVGSKDATTGTTHLPPSRVGIGGGAVDDMEPAPMADTEGTIVTFTVDRLAYSPSPPIVFAVVDFDGGGRMPIELTDVDPAEVAVGGRVAMTFRRLHSADGIHNYFWKARPVRG